MNTYRIQIDFYNAEKEDNEVKAESSRKALITYLESTPELEERNISTIKIQRIL